MCSSSVELYTSMSSIKNQDKLVHKFLEYGVHNVLESSWGVCQPEGHDQKLIQPLMCPECSLVLIPFCHTDLVIPRPQIQFSEPLSPRQLIQKFFYH
jgi:hypothetical protein